MAPRFGGDRWTSELWFQHSLRTKVQFCSWLVSLVGLNGSEPAYWSVLGISSCKGTVFGLVKSNADEHAMATTHHR
ncbi:hypothetical protein YC2023_116724 [Brassica napus]